MCLNLSGNFFLIDVIPKVTGKCHEDGSILAFSVDTVDPGTTDRFLPRYFNQIGCTDKCFDLNKGGLNPPLMYMK